MYLKEVFDISFPFCQSLYIEECAHIDQMSFKKRSKPAAPTRRKDEDDSDSDVNSFLCNIPFIIQKYLGYHRCREG